MSVQIKPLEWTAHPYMSRDEARSAIGLYMVEETTRAIYLHGPRDDLEEACPISFASWDEAKAAAQSDYEARIRSALAERNAEPLEHVEKVSTEAAMSQWERSLKRPDLCEKDRVRGAVEAYKRQAFAFAISPTPPAEPVTGPMVLLRKVTDELEDVVFRNRSEWTDDIYALLNEARAALSTSPSPVDSRDGVIERLTKALEPFADAVEKADATAADMGFAPSFDAYAPEWSFTFGQLREARAALLAAKEQQP